jgi:hypothetical protein
MARFSSSKLRSAINRYNSAVRSHDARVRSAISAYNREVRRYNDLLRSLRTQQRRVVVFYQLEWTTLTTTERVKLEQEATSRGIEIQVQPDDTEADGFDSDT